jgi:hypothetical protein
MCRSPEAAAPPVRADLAAQADLAVQVDLAAQVDLVLKADLVPLVVLEQVLPPHPQFRPVALVPASLWPCPAPTLA